MSEIHNVTGLVSVCISECDAEIVKVVTDADARTCQECLPHFLSRRIVIDVLHQYQRVHIRMLQYRREEVFASLNGTDKRHFHCLCFHFSVPCLLCLNSAYSRRLASAAYISLQQGRFATVAEPCARLAEVGNAEIQLHAHAFQPADIGQFAAQV